MGGGGGGDGGAGAAQQLEKERQARIKAATDAINATFNNKVQQQGTRYVSDGLGSFRRGTPTYMDEAEYRRQEALYKQALAKNGGPLQWDEYGNAIGNHLIGRQQPLTPDEMMILQTFNPSAWRAEKFTTWVDGDPANSRENLYSQQRSAVFDLNRMEVDRQATDAERINRFGLARSGLMGGSAQIDSVADINRRTNEGLMRAGGIADQASADLRTADEQARANLISLAQSGIDTGTAASQALNSLRVNNANAASARAGATVGGLFNDLGQAYLMNQMNAGRMAGMNNPSNQQWYGVSNPRTGNAGTVTR